MPTPLDLYTQHLQAGHIKPDPVQLMAMEKLTTLYDALLDYHPEDGGRADWLRRLMPSLRGRPNPPQGLYLHGDVGRGKSMLMDFFFQAIPFKSKRRVHFHEFMHEVHDHLHKWRKGLGKWQGKEQADPMPTLAKHMLHKHYVLCFDEFHVTDITDAMILKRLFDCLFEEGLVMVATSNWPPDDLYKDGLQRDSFIPFIQLLKRRLEVFELNGEDDYRRLHLKQKQRYYHPATPAATLQMEELFLELTNGDPGQSDVLVVQNRPLTLPRAASGVAWFTFEELCASPDYGARAYLALATHLHTLFLQDIPQLTADKDDQAKRLMLLVDALYENDVTVVASGAVAFEALYKGRLLDFEFSRTVSRLVALTAATDS